MTYSFLHTKSAYNTLASWEVWFLVFLSLQTPNIERLRYFLLLFSVVMLHYSATTSTGATRGFLTNQKPIRQQRISICGFKSQPNLILKLTCIFQLWEQPRQIQNFDECFEAAAFDFPTVCTVLVNK